MFGFDYSIPIVSTSVKEIEDPFAMKNWFHQLLPTIQAIKMISAYIGVSRV